MPFFRTDDMLHSHPKARRAGLPAIGLWSLAGSYCMAYKTNGFVPGWFVADFPQGRKLAQRLVSVGLWETAIQDEQAGYLFHDFLDYNPSAEEIERDRERARERSRKFRRKLRGDDE